MDKVIVRNDNIAEPGEIITKCMESIKDSTPLSNMTKREVNGVQVRTSARVLKKLKMDQEAMDAAAAAVIAEPVPTVSQKETKTSHHHNNHHHNQHTNHNNSVSHTNISLPTKTVIASDTVQKPKPKRRFLWKAEDVRSFFEGVNENGKRFAAIADYINNKAKKRNNSSSDANHDLQNGDIEKKIMKSHVRSLFINFWWKIAKFVKFPDNIPKYVQELYAIVNYGELRRRVGIVNEKNFHKVNELIYCGSTTIRSRSKTWRVRTPVCKTLKSLNSINDKPDDIRLPIKLEIILTPRDTIAWNRVQSLSHNPRLKSHLASNTSLVSLITALDNRWNLCKDTDELLRIGPKTGLTINKPSLKMGNIVTSSQVNLISYERRVNGELGAQQLEMFVNQMGLIRGKFLSKWQKEEIINKADLPKDLEIIDPYNITSHEKRGKEVIYKEENQEEYESRIMKGWNVKTSFKMPISELYLMFGNKGTIELEYWWEYETKDDSKNVNDVKVETSNFTKTLQRLISIGKLYQTKIKIECPCGHVCKPKNVNNKKSSNNLINIKNLHTESETIKIKEEIIDDSEEIDENKPNKNLTKDANLIVNTNIFKKPVLPSSKFRNSTNSLFDTFQFRSKYCNRRGRRGLRGTGSNVAVQRILPLLPKSTGTPISFVVLGPGGQFEAVNKPVTTMNKTVAILPKHQPATQNQPTQPIFSNTLFCQAKTNEEAKENLTSDVVTGVTTSPLFSSANNLLTTTANEENSMTFLLNFNNDVKATTTLIENQPSSFAGILSGVKNEDTFNNVLTPSTSPTRILKEGENQWLNSDADFSLSSILGHLESPMKQSIHEDSRFSVDIESHGYFNDTSVDFGAKFEEITSKIQETLNTKIL